MHKLGARMIASTAALGLAAGSVALAVPAQSAEAGTTSVAAAAKKKKDKPLKVMTLNLYLGGSLGSVIEAIEEGKPLGEILATAGALYDSVMATDFPKRAKWIAQTVKKENPDIITLNELTDWRTDGALPEYEYLEIFLDALKKEGMKFGTAIVDNNADIELGPVKVPYSNPDTPGCEDPSKGCGWELKDRDGILYNKKSKGLKFLNKSDYDHFTDQQVFEAFGYQIDFNRGWAAARFKWQGKKVAVMTGHLEVESTDGGDPSKYGPKNWPSEVQVSQGKELVKAAKMEAKKTGGRVILAGDFNSDANGYYSPTYANMTKYFKDSWVQVGNKIGKKAEGATCCHSGDLNTAKKVMGTYMDSGDPVIPTRLDLVLNRKATATEVAILGDKRRSKTQPFWESDHLFYSADVVLK